MKLKFLATALTLWALVYAHPAFAQISPEPDASLSECAGCQRGNITVVFDGGMATAQGLAYDASTGEWVGSGSVINYNRDGVVANGPASFRVVFKKAIAYDLTPCSQAGVPIDTFVDSFKILCGNVLFASSGAPRFDTSACPTERITAQAEVISKAFGRVKKDFHSSAGSVKATYLRQVNGRVIRVSN